MSEVWRAEGAVEGKVDKPTVWRVTVASVGHRWTRGKSYVARHVSLTRHPGLLSQPADSARRACGTGVACFTRYRECLPGWDPMNSLRNPRRDY